MGQNDGIGVTSGAERGYLDQEKGAHGYHSTVLEPGEFEVPQESTKRGLKSRHAQMIALGRTIGTGLFVGSGATLANEVALLLF